MAQCGRLLPFLALVSLPALAATRVGPQLPGRLPPEVVPIHYDMRFDPDAAHLVFSGSETITVSVLRPTRTIVMNAADVTVGRALLDGKASPTKISFDQRAETVSLAVRHPELAFHWAVAHADAVNALIETSSRAGFIVSLAESSANTVLVDRVQAYADRAIRWMHARG